MTAMALSEPHPCHNPACSGICSYDHDEHGSLVEGGSYEVYLCDTCGHRTYSPMPD